MTDYTNLEVIKEDSDFELDVDDNVLSGMITAASRFIDCYCGREKGFFIADTTASARYYSGSGKVYQFIDPCIEITEVAVKDSATDDTYTTWTADDDYWEFSGDPEYPDFNTLPYTAIMTNPTGDYVSFTSGQWVKRRGFKPVSPYGRATKTVKVTAKWGYAEEVPSDIERACIMLVTRWFNRQRGGMTDTLVSANLGRLIYTQKIDPDIAAILNDGRWKVPTSGLL